MTEHIYQRIKPTLLGLTMGFMTCQFVSAGPLVIDDAAPLVKPTLDTRIRYEYADIDGLNSSNNFSIRNRLGLLTKEINGFQFFGEYEGTVVADKYDYWSGPVVRGNPGRRSIIADPISHEINQLWLSYVTLDDTLAFKVGRQAINIDNQRYVGGVAWRQNMQTFDAATVKWTPSADWEFNYSYVNQVNRIFGSRADDPGDDVRFFDFDGNTHLVNVKYKALPFGTLTGYAYSMDLNRKSDGNATASNNSFGFHLTGDVCDTDVTYYLEYGHQTDAYNNPNSYAANYGHGNVSFPVTEKVSATVGMEYLGSDNGIGYQFPLATLHKFNGFADRFLVATPGTGLTDMYVMLATKLPGDIGAKFFYHHFQDDDFGTEFGNEFDVVLTKKLSDRALLLGKGAFFAGNNTGFSDISRVSMELNYKF